MIEGVDIESVMRVMSGRKKLREKNESALSLTIISHHHIITSSSHLPLNPYRKVFRL